MRQKESLTGEESVRLIRKALEHNCETVDLTFTGNTRHDLLGSDNEPLPTASLPVYVPIEDFLKRQSTQLEGGLRMWNWEIVYDISEQQIKHLYLLSTQWSQESAQEAEARLIKEKVEYNSLMRDIKEEEEE